MHSEVKTMEDLSSVVTNMEQELRRGTVTLCVLSRLDQPKYGYALVEELAGVGISIEPGTLYPLLRRLESQGLLISEWETSGPKPRKYYVRGEAGERIYKLLCGEWNELARSIERLIAGPSADESVGEAAQKEGKQ
jgi:DNA-binding PadR family transcriptional regulator